MKRGVRADDFSFNDFYAHYQRFFVTGNISKYEAKGMVEKTRWVRRNVQV